MKTVTIRECAVKACDVADSGDELLLAICKEAITGEPLDWESIREYKRDELRPVYEAIAPDILDSVKGGDELQTKASITITGGLHSFDCIDMGGDE